MSSSRPPSSSWVNQIWVINLLTKLFRLLIWVVTIFFLMHWTIEQRHMRSYISCSQRSEMPKGWLSWNLAFPRSVAVILGRFTLLNKIKGYLRCGKVLQLKGENTLALKIYERGLEKVKIGADNERTVCPRMTCSFSLTNYNL
jgi:hypothetical protein